MSSSPKGTIEHYFTEKPKSLRKLGLIRTLLRGKPFEFNTAASVFSAKRVDLGTRVLIENMRLPYQGCTLDIGCGYGAVGIAAAKFNPSLNIVLTDLNYRAVQLARQNIEKNRIFNAEVRQGSLYEPVSNCCFDAVLSNPPVSAGMEKVQAIIRGAPSVMVCNGTLQMVIQSKIGKKMLPEVFLETFGNVEVLARQSGYRVLMGKKQQE